MPQANKCLLAEPCLSSVTKLGHDALENPFDPCTRKSRKCISKKLSADFLHHQLTDVAQCNVLLNKELRNIRSTWRKKSIESLH